MMFRQRLRGGHRVSNQSKQNLNQHSACQNQGEWNSVPSKENSPGAWDGQSSDSAWNWDVNSDTNANLYASVSPHQQNSVPQVPQTEPRNYPLSNSLGFPKSGSNTDLHSANVPSTSTYNLTNNAIYSTAANSQHQRFQSSASYTQPFIEQEVKPSDTHNNLSKTFHNPQINHTFLPPKYDTINPIPSTLSQTTSHPSSVQVTDGSWNEWESWDDWNGTQPHNEGEEQNPVLTFPNHKAELPSIESSTPLSYAQNQQANISHAVPTTSLNVTHLTNPSNGSYNLAVSEIGLSTPRQVFHQDSSCFLQNDQQNDFHLDNKIIDPNQTCDKESVSENTPLNFITNSESTLSQDTSHNIASTNMEIYDEKSSDEVANLMQFHSPEKAHHEASNYELVERSHMVEGLHKCEPIAISPNNANTDPEELIEKGPECVEENDWGWEKDDWDANPEESINRIINDESIATLGEAFHYESHPPKSDESVDIVSSFKMMDLNVKEEWVENSNVSSSAVNFDYKELQVDNMEGRDNEIAMGGSGEFLHSVHSSNTQVDLEATHQYNPLEEDKVRYLLDVENLTNPNVACSKAEESSQTIKGETLKLSDDSGYAAKGMSQPNLEDFSSSVIKKSQVRDDADPYHLSMPEDSSKSENSEPFIPSSANATSIAESKDLCFGTDKTDQEPIDATFEACIPSAEPFPKNNRDLDTKINDPVSSNDFTANNTNKIMSHSLSSNEVLLEDDNIRQALVMENRSESELLFSSKSVYGPVGAIPEIKARRESPFQPFSKNPVKESESPGHSKPSESFLWSDSRMPELPVKLTVAATEIEKPKSVEPLVGGRPFVSLLADKAFVNESHIRVSESQAVSHSSSHLTGYNSSESSHDQHSSDLQHPKVITLANQSFYNSPAPSKELDRDSKPDTPIPEQDFRMIPGESTKGESSSKNIYQVPTTTPSMPTGRVVTGNDDPQPALLSRIKQEPNEVRMPPDGPDTEPLSDPTPPVVPPIRSETIGSEEPTARSFSMKDARSEKMSSSRHERSWDREKKEYYIDKYRERAPDSREYYTDESPHNKIWSYERDYDRHRRRYDSDEEEEIDYAESSRSRRNRAYRDEMDRYGDKIEKDERERYPRREKKKRYDKHRGYAYPQEEENRHYYDRSQPTSRSSSYTHLDESSSNSHTVRHRDNFYSDRPHHSGDRELHYRDGRHERKAPIDPYYRGYSSYADHYRPRDMYDPQSYYYYYQKYLEHPYYREYYRQYFERYGYPGAADSLIDDKTSTRSGRSSVNDELKKSSISSMALYDPYGYYYRHSPRPASESSQYLQEFHNSPFFENFGEAEYKPSPIYPNSSLGHSKRYQSGDISGAPSITDEINEAPQRATPPLFDVLHSSVSFTPCGKLICALPNDPKEGEKALVEIIPLHKILSRDKEYALRIEKMKGYPGPLVKQDTHKDIVIQFCENTATKLSHAPNFPDKDSAILLWHYLALLVKQNGKVCGADLANLLLKRKDATTTTDTSDESQLKDSQADSGTDDQLAVAALSPSPKDQTRLIGQFRDLISIGMTKEAVDFAVQNELWVYALAVASKMDAVTQTKVMSAIDSCIPSSDVIQTLMQHLSGKRPDVTKSYSSSRWGDWRQHLAVMVSNPSSQPERDQASILALGDLLASREQIYASHLCYLAGEAEWGSFSAKDSRLVLLGSSHHQNFKAFTAEDAIHCTEIYEYAKSLDNSNSLMSTFQSYKLIYAIRLAECGFPAKALKYCEVITTTVAKNPYSFHVEFVSKVSDLATQLKYHDVHYKLGQGEISEMADPDWLQTLYQTLYALQYYMSQQQQQTQASQAQEESQSLPQNISSMDITAKPMEVQANQTLVVNSDYSSFQPETEAPHGIASQSGLVGPSFDESRHHQPSIQPRFEEQQQLQSLPPELEPPPPMYIPTQSDSLPPNFSESSMVPPLPADPHGFTMQEPQHPYLPPPPVSLSQPSIPPPQQDIPQLPLSSVSPLAHSPSPFPYDERDHSYLSHQPPQETDVKPDTSSAVSQEKEPKEGENPKDKKQPGFLSRIFGWKESNQAKLPDDKNPSIVWDPDKKCWINKDGDDDEVSAPPPPPMASVVPSNSGNFRGPKKTRYVNPVSGRDTAKSPVAPLMPMPTGMVPPSLNQAASHGHGGAFPPENDHNPHHHENSFLELPPQIRRIRYASESSSIDLEDDWGPLGSQQADGDGGHVPLIQPMLYSPEQFQPQSQNAAVAARKLQPFQTRRVNYNPNQR